MRWRGGSSAEPPYTRVMKNSAQPSFVSEAIKPVTAMADSGAMAGGAFGSLANYLFPDFTAAPEAYALVGMGGVVAGTTHAPIQAFLILFELTGDYRLMPALMMIAKP